MKVFQQIQRNATLIATTSILFLQAGGMFVSAAEMDESAAGLTKLPMGGKRPHDGIQLVGERGHVLIAENPEFKNQWVFKDGILTASPMWDSLVTPDNYQDFKLHVEFNVNDVPGVGPEQNGNSGIYIQKRYELQILNSHGIAQADYKPSYAGSMYKQKMPDKLASKPAGEWQTYDIVFRAARFEADKKVASARISVMHNGVLIHDDYALTNKTGAGKNEGSEPMPIMLQGHQNQVKFRNVWVQRLNLEPVKKDAQEGKKKVTTT